MTMTRKDYQETAKILFEKATGANNLEFNF